MRLLCRAAGAGAMLAALLLPQVGAGPGGPPDPPRRVSYVESSSGLVQPTLDGGGTEVEMGDVDGDGWLDLVSVGDHGSPFVNTDQHGVMVWFGDGTGSWSVVMAGDFGYGGVALGDVNGDGLLDVADGIHHDYSSTDLVNSDRYQWRIPPDTRSAVEARIRLTLAVGANTAVATTPRPFIILGGDLLFADSFESGDTSAWSAAVP